MTSLENGSLMNGKVHVTWLVSSMCDDDGLCRVVNNTKNSIIRKILFYVIIQSKRHLEQMKLYTWVVW